MKTTITLALLLAVLILPAVTATLNAQGLNKEAVAFVKTYQDAYNKGSLPALMAMYSDKVGFVSNRDGSVTVVPKADVEADFVRDFGETVGSYMDLTVNNTETLADGKVNVTSTFTGYDFDRKTGAKLNPASGTQETVIAKEGSQWKIGQVKTVFNSNVIRLELRDFVKKFQDAVNREDVAALKTMFTTDIVRTAADGTTTKGVDQVADVYTKRFADADVNNLITLANVTPQFDGSVVVTGTYHQNGRSVKGDRVMVDGAFTNTAIKENGQWKTRQQKLTNLVKTMVYHKVADYATWKKTFDTFQGERMFAGELSAEVGTLQDDPSTVYVINEWASPEAAQTFFARPELAATMQKAGVTGKPTVLILSKK
ncbi:DUF4440 domain-containing protein [Spirosoma areae]